MHRVYAPSTPENAELKLAKLEAWRVYVSPFEMKIAEKRRTVLCYQCASHLDSKTRHPERIPEKGLGGADHSTFHTQMILHQNLEHFQSGQGLEKCDGWESVNPGTYLDFGGESNLGTEKILVAAPELVGLTNWKGVDLRRYHKNQESKSFSFQLDGYFRIDKRSPKPNPHLGIRD